MGLSRPPHRGGDTIISFAIITTTANELLHPLHARIAGWIPWLGKTATQLKALLKSYPSAGMAFWPVDRRVGNVGNDSPDLFTPID